MTQRILVLIGLLVVSQNVQGAARDGAARGGSGAARGVVSAVHVTPPYGSSMGAAVAVDNLALGAKAGGAGLIVDPADFLCLVDLTASKEDVERLAAQLEGFQKDSSTFTLLALTSFLKETMRMSAFWSEERVQTLLALCRKNGISEESVLACLALALMRNSSY